MSRCDQAMAAHISWQVLSIDPRVVMFPSHSLTSPAQRTKVYQGVSRCITWALHIYSVNICTEEKPQKDILKTDEQTKTYINRESQTEEDKEFVLKGPTLR